MTWKAEKRSETYFKCCNTTYKCTLMGISSKHAGVLWLDYLVMSVLSQKNFTIPFFQSQQV